MARETRSETWSASKSLSLRDAPPIGPKNEIRNLREKRKGEGEGDGMGIGEGSSGQGKAEGIEGLGWEIRRRYLRQG